VVLDLPARQRHTVAAMESAGARMTVGQVAAAVGVTPKALRHYDRLGLFRPDGVDDGNGYRWYRADRLGEARLIARLRSVGVPLDDVAECLESGGEPEVVERVLRAHQRRLEARSARVRGDLHRLTHLLIEEETDMEPAVEPTAVPDGLPTPPPDTRAPAVGSDERALAVDLFNGVWRLMETENRTPAEDDRMLHMAHASRYHWEQVGAPVNLARGEWQCSRVYAVLGRAEPCLHHARRVLELCEEHGIGDWDLAFAHEALARGHAIAGDGAAARAEVDRALATPIADPEDRALLLSDLETVPGITPPL
jgi:DNA-binding transcriptional MerR regulator